MGNISAKDIHKQVKKNVQPILELQKDTSEQITNTDTLGGGQNKKIISKFRKERSFRKSFRNNSKINIRTLNLRYLLNLSESKFNLISNNYNKSFDSFNDIVAEMSPSQYLHFFYNLKKNKIELDKLKEQDKINQDKYTKINKIYVNILDKNKLPKKQVNETLIRKKSKKQYKTKKGGRNVKQNRHNKSYKSNNLKNMVSQRDKYNTRRRQCHRGKKMRRYHRFKN